jgi:hypothetical protein
MTRTLNNNTDGPHAFSNPQAVTHWNNTQWLIDYVDHNNEVNDANWGDWDDAEAVRTTYFDDRHGSDTHGEIVEIGERGAAILNAAIKGEQWAPLMAGWEATLQQDQA